MTEDLPQKGVKYIKLTRSTHSNNPLLHVFVHIFYYVFIHTFDYVFIHIFDYTFVHIFYYIFVQIFDYVFVHIFVYVQGDFFHWYPPNSVPTRKSLSSQSRPFLVTGFTGTAALIG